MDQILVYLARGKHLLLGPMKIHSACAVKGDTRFINTHVLERFLPEAGTVSTSDPDGCTFNPVPVLEGEGAIGTNRQVTSTGHPGRPGHIPLGAQISGSGR